MRVHIARTHPTLYRQIMFVAIWQVGLAVNFWISRPTFNPLGIHKTWVGVICAVIGVSQMIALNAIRDLRAIRLTMEVSIFCTLAWGLLNTEQSIRGNASYQLPWTFAFLIAGWQVLLVLESPVNPMTRKAT